MGHEIIMRELSDMYIYIYFSLTTKSSKIENLIVEQSFHITSYHIHALHSHHTVIPIKTESTRFITGSNPFRLVPVYFVINWVGEASRSRWATCTGLFSVIEHLYIIINFTYLVAWTAIVMFSELASTIFNFRSKKSFVSLGFFST